MFYSDAFQYTSTVNTRILIWSRKEKSIWLMAGEETLVWNMGYAIIDLLYYVSDQRDHTEDRSKGIREVFFINQVV